MLDMARNNQSPRGFLSFLSLWTSQYFKQDECAAACMYIYGKQNGNIFLESEIHMLKFMSTDMFDP